MKTTSKLALSFVLVVTLSHAFPPAPHHLFYGMIRDEYGNPIQGDNVEVLLETSAGLKLRASLNDALEPGINYRLPVPMDAGVTSDLYKATALRPTVPFKIKVKIGQMTFLPIEMVADFSRLGQPGQRTFLNLTLGEDADGDGIPDAWERALLQMSGNTGTLSDIRPGDDTDGDGLSNIDEYLAGSYAFDPENGFGLEIVDYNGDAPTLEFTVVRGRTYIVEGSDDLRSWTPVSFQEIGGAGSQSLYRATDVRLLQIQVAAEPGGRAPNFYRLIAH